MEETFEQRWWRINAEEAAMTINDLEIKREFLKGKLKEFRDWFKSKDALDVEKGILEELADLQFKIQLKQLNKSNQQPFSKIEGMEPINMIKAWIIIIEQQKKESILKVIERITKKYDWQFSYNSLKNTFIPDLRKTMANAITIKSKSDITNKHKEDLILAITFLKDKESRLKAQNILKNFL